MPGLLLPADDRSVLQATPFALCFVAAERPILSASSFILGDAMPSNVVEEGQVSHMMSDLLVALPTEIFRVSNEFACTIN